MSESLENEIRSLRVLFWSERDPSGYGFASLADAYRRAGDLAEARELIADGLDRHPNFASGHVVAAWVARDRGDVEAARNSLERVLQLDPENVVALRELGELAQEDGREREALSYYTRLQELEPGDSAVDERVGRLRGLEGAEVGAEAEEASGEDEVVESEAVAPVADEAEAEAEVVEPPAPEEPEDFGEHEELEVLEEPVDLEEPVHEALDEPEELEELDLADAAADLTREEEGWAEEPAAEDEDEGELYTATMAELYVRQGLHARAKDVYERLLEADPENEAFRERLAEVREIVEGSPRQEEASGEVEEVWAVEDAPAGGEETGAEERSESEDEVEVLAHGAAQSPSEEIETPFAWSAETEAEGVAPTTDVTDGRTTADYFEDLLAWVPGAIPVESLAPETEAAEPESGEAHPGGAEPAAVPVESLSPEPPAPEEVGEEAVSIESLAPDALPEAEAPPTAGVVEVEEAEEVESQAVPIESLAPDVEVEERADVGAVPIESLAPDAVPEDDGGEEAGSGGDDEEMDDFQKWLNSMGR